MKTIYCVITNLGDGSNGLQWYKSTPKATLEKLEETDPESYSSGDGIQITTLEFPDNFNLDDIKGIYWFDEDLNEGALT